ncbi:MAG TPA: carboxypeptidase-like regulatory domain-containing protein, partial [Blastocatellia bacterium]|nr:carboxypeptidase-like regulatory domain-containing protein [Blastocatellia bacterium]
MKNLLAILCIAAALALAPAVSADTTGTILGLVTDPQGAVIAGATVTARQTATNLTRVTKTDQSGAYRFAALPLGPYELKVEAAGFKPGAGRLTLEINQERRADITLQVEGVAGETVDVVASDVISSETSTVGTVIDNQKITDLPLNGRNFLQLGALIAGVAAAPGGGGSEGGTYVGAFRG